MFSKSCFALKHSRCRKKQCDCHCHQPDIPNIYKRVDEATLDEIDAWMRHPRIVRSADTLNPQHGGLWPEVARRLMRELVALKTEKMVNLAVEDAKKLVKVESALEAATARRRILEVEACRAHTDPHDFETCTRCMARRELGWIDISPITVK